MSATGNSRFRDFVEQIRARIDIAELIGRDVDLRPSGSCLKGLSPFHPERTPSLVVWPATQSWHDFSNGGGLGGDVFAWLQQRTGCTFREAVYRLAEEAGVKRPDQSDADFNRELSELEERRDVERVMTLAAAYYHRALPADIREALFRNHYGFTDATIDALQLGWANGELFRHLTKEQGVTPDLALKTGLFVQFATGGIADLFQYRLVFPYWRNGRVVYFIARRTDRTPDKKWEEPKYKKLLTHSEKHAYVSKTVGNDFFYGEDAIGGADEILVTEGITDAISASQAGVPTVSPVTTRFRSKDAPKLLALTLRAKRIIICNDAESNGAGEKGALDTAALLHREGRDVRIATLPRPEGIEKVDVNEFCKQHDEAALKALLAEAVPYPSFLLGRIPSDTLPAELPRLLEPVIEAVALAHPIARDTYLTAIVDRFQLKMQTVQGMVREAKATAAAAECDSADDSSEEDRFRGRVFESEVAYYAFNRNGVAEVISSFLLEPVKRICCDGSEVIVADARAAAGKTIRGISFPNTAWHSKKEFLRALKSPDLQWTGTDEHVQGVLKLVSAVEVPTGIGTSNLGYHETAAGPRWAAPGVVMTPSGFAEADELVYVPNGAKLPSRLRYAVVAPDEVRRLAAQVLPRLLHLNKGTVVHPITGWFFATPFRPRILRLRRHFAILLVWGTQGSGKTSIITGVYWPLFGVAMDVDAFSATETEFAQIRLFSCTDSVPIFVDEYKPRDMTKLQVDRLHRLLRRIYGGETEERGRPDLSLASYRLSAPVCLAGESPPDGDAALRERLLSVSPDKNYLEANPACQEAFLELTALPLARLAPSYIQFALGRDTERDLEETHALTVDLIAEVADSSSVPSRCRDNIEVMLFGLAMYRRFAESLGVEIPELDPAPAVAACLRAVMDGDGAIKDAFDHFLESLSVYALNGALEPNCHFAVVNGRLRLHLASCYEVYLTERRRAGQEDNTNGRQALLRIADEKADRGGYVTSVEKRVELGSRYVRTVEIALEEVPATMDVDGFSSANDRSWGGRRENAGEGEPHQ